MRNIHRLTSQFNIYLYQCDRLTSQFYILFTDATDLLHNLTSTFTDTTDLLPQFNIYIYQRNRLTSRTFNGHITTLRKGSCDPKKAKGIGPNPRSFPKSNTDYPPGGLKNTSSHPLFVFTP